MATDVLHHLPSVSAPAFPGLAEVLRQEARGLEEFAAVLERQRAAVAAGDRVTLDGSVEDVDRLLLRLSKLREQRQNMVDHLTGERGWSLTQLLERPGFGAGSELVLAHRELRRAAENAARASRVNSVVLRRVLESERAFLQSLFSDGPVVGYPGASGGRSAGLLLDRQG